MAGRERFPSRCDLFCQPLWIQNELLLITPRGDAEVDEFEATFVLRARVAKKPKTGLGASPRKIPNKRPQQSRCLDSKALFCATEGTPIRAH
jgi:hypothetical protein